MLGKFSDEGFNLCFQFSDAVGVGLLLSRCRLVEDSLDAVDYLFLVHGRIDNDFLTFR